VDPTPEFLCGEFHRRKPRQRRIRRRMAGIGAQPCRFRQFRRRSHPICRPSSCICQLAFVELTAKPPEAKLDRGEDTKVARAPARFSKSLARWVDMEHAMVELGVRHLHMIGEAEAPLKRAPRILIMQQNRQIEWLRDLPRGPGRLTAALRVDCRFDEPRRPSVGSDAVITNPANSGRATGSESRNAKRPL